MWLTVSWVRSQMTRSSRLPGTATNHSPLLPSSSSSNFPPPESRHRPASANPQTPHFLSRGPHSWRVGNPRRQGHASQSQPRGAQGVLPASSVSDVQWGPKSLSSSSDLWGRPPGTPQSSPWLPPPTPQSSISPTHLLNTGNESARNPVTVSPRVAVSRTRSQVPKCRLQVRPLRLIQHGVYGFTLSPVKPGHQDPGQERHPHDHPASGQKQIQPTRFLPAVPSPSTRGLLRPRAALPSATALRFLGLCDPRCLWILGAP